MSPSGSRRRSRARRSASSAPAMSARPSPSSPRPSSWSPMAGRRSRWSGRRRSRSWPSSSSLFTKDDPDLARRRALRPEARVAVGDDGAAEEHPGLALLALLLLRLRRLRRAGAVAAALPDRRLRPRHHDRRHDRRRLLDPGLDLPRLWRPPLRQVRRAPHHVLDLPRLGRLHLHPVLSADPLRRRGHPRAGRVLDARWASSASSSSPSCSASS